MSSGSESDDDYVPEENPAKLSEEESADDETEKQYENEQEQKATKRKQSDEGKGNKKRKTKCTRSNANEAEEDEPEEKVLEEVDSEEQKKKDDDLWAMFLDGTDTKPKPKETPKPMPSKQATSTVPLKPVVYKPEAKAKSNDAAEKEKRIFEFAGETIVVENNVIKERVKTGDSPATVSKLPTISSSGSGISGVLGALNRKNKLSVLEKSKLDWTTLKKDEGIEEEIESHNKGKQGFLERRDFLERADMRQYEIERDLRMSRRSNR